MRRTVSVVCAFLGAFLVVGALLAQTWGTGQLRKIPLDASSVTRLSGTAVEYRANGPKEFPVKMTNIVTADSAKSDADVVVFATSTCLVRDTGGVGGCTAAGDRQRRLLAESFDDFAADRSTGLAVNDPNRLPADAVPHHGLVARWPAAVQRKDYPFWVSGVGAVDAVYQGVAKVRGLDTYRFHVTVTNAPLRSFAGCVLRSCAVAQLAGRPPGRYDESTTLWVEPTTGLIVDRTTRQVRATQTGHPVFELDVAFTDRQVGAAVADAKAAADRLRLTTRTVPAVGYLAGGALLLLGGVLFLARGIPARSRSRSHRYRRGR